MDQRSTDIAYDNIFNTFDLYGKLKTEVLIGDYHVIRSYTLSYNGYIPKDNDVWYQEYTFLRKAMSCSHITPIYITEYDFDARKKDESPYIVAECSSCRSRAGDLYPKKTFFKDIPTTSRVHSPELAIDGYKKCLKDRGVDTYETPQYTKPQRKMLAGIAKYGSAQRYISFRLMKIKRLIEDTYDMKTDSEISYILDDLETVIDDVQDFMQDPHYDK